MVDLFDSTVGTEKSRMQLFDRRFLHKRKADSAKQFEDLL
jgi:hypothetical protein